MKRTYHYFVDETCYADYCESFLERRQKLVAEEKKWLKEEKQRLVQEIKQQVQEKKAEEEAETELWYKTRRKYLIMLISSLVIIVFCVLIGWDSWLIAVAALLMLYSGFRLYSIGAIDDGNNEVGGEE